MGFQKSLFDRVAERFPPGFTLPDPWAIRPVVLDTNVVLMMFRHYLRSGGRSALLGAATAGMVKFFAADHVLVEVREKLPVLAPKWGVDSVHAVSTFDQEFGPWIRFVDVSGIEASDPRFSEIEDVDDRPTGVLACVLAPSVVLSLDPDLVEVDLAYPDWLPPVLAGAGLGNFARGGVGLTMLLDLGIRGTDAAVRGINRHVTVSMAIAGVILFAAGLASATGHLRVDRGTVSRSVSASLQATRTAFDRMSAYARLQSERLDRATIGRSTPPSAIDQLARFLALEPCARTPKEIAAAMQLSASPLTESQVLVLLTSTKAFQREGRWGWRFGG